MYNELPKEAVEHNCVKDFQKCLQNELKAAAEAQRDNWENLHNRRKRSYKQVTVKVQRKPSKLQKQN